MITALKKIRILLKQKVNRQALISVGITLFTLASGTAALNVYVNRSTSKLAFDKISELPSNEYGLLLGTSKTIHRRENFDFSYRIKAAAELFRQGKIKYIIASGSNYPRYGYNEPRDMQAALIKAGVPVKNILKDEHGFRTLDSVLNAKKHFGIDKFTIISQKYHNARALFIARFYAMKPVAYNAHEMDLPMEMAYHHLRESLAKVKMLFDFVRHPELPNYMPRKSSASPQTAQNPSL
ncbi:ElyC/SanA/YdcF family protein [Lentisphaerota bacterium ZTH]|nr:YdcF family protein [Lentisphaerota bacterium]WET05509.1 ElyC/SanA/YdcF family protein [Lentisphaerota bacterium ZTH]